MKYFSYWLLPVVSGVFWLTTLVSLLVYWAVGTNKTTAWPWMEVAQGQTIAYISDVGASKLKPWFIVGSCFTVVFLNLSFVADRLLRHNGRLVPESSLGQKVLYSISLFFAMVGMIGLPCLSGFDTHHYPTLHDCFLLIFMAGYLLSAIFICWEYQRLGKKYRQHRILRISFWVKLTFVLVELGLAIAFGVCNFTGAYNTAAILEWTIAFVFVFYVFSFCLDLAPAVHTQNEARFSKEPMRTLDIPTDWDQTHTHGLRQPDVLRQEVPRPTQDTERTLYPDTAHPSPEPPKPADRPVQDV